MLQLLKNEYIKLFKKKKNIGLMIVFLVVIIGMTGLYYIDEKDMLYWNNPNNVIKENAIQLERYKESITDINIKLKEDLPEKEKIKLIEMKDDIERTTQLIYNNNKLMQEKIENPKTWREELEERLAAEKNEYEKLKNDKIISLETKYYMEEKIYQSEYYLENNIEPMEPWQVTPTIALFRLSIILVVGIPGFIALFGSDIVSDESSNETFKFLLIQPVRRSKILLAKFIALLTTVYTVILGGQALLFLTIGGIRGFEDLNQLVKIGLRFELDKEILIKENFRAVSLIPESGEFVKFGTLLIQHLILQIIFIFVCCAIVFMISTIFKSSLVTISIATIVLVAGSALPYFLNDKIAGILQYSFLAYGDTVSVIVGHAQERFTNPALTASAGAIIMVVTGVIAYLIAAINFDKKDILL